jgi:SAM-dependent methyltransferase
MNIKPKIYNEIDFDSVESSERAVHIMRSKKCLRDIYIEIYSHMMFLRNKLLSINGKVLEIGSGGGFIKDIFPEVTTSDIKPINNVDMVINAETLPFDDNSLDAILAVHVIHHIPDIVKFLTEANRVLKVGGGIICVEPYWSPLGRFIYKNAHPEPFDQKAETWLISGNTPMTSSNQALSFLLLKRDRIIFAELFPEFKVAYRKRFGFIRYIMTGGVWLEKKLPDFMFPLLKIIEFLLTPLMPLIALHHIFVWKKIS